MVGVFREPDRAINFLKTGPGYAFILLAGHGSRPYSELVRVFLVWLFFWFRFFLPYSHETLPLPVPLPWELGEVNRTGGGPGLCLWYHI